MLIPNSIGTNSELILQCNECEKRYLYDSQIVIVYLLHSKSITIAVDSKAVHSVLEQNYRILSNKVTKPDMSFILTRQSYLQLQKKIPKSLNPTIDTKDSVLNCQGILFSLLKKTTTPM